MDLDLMLSALAQGRSMLAAARLEAKDARGGDAGMIVVHLNSALNSLESAIRIVGKLKEAGHGA